MRKSGRHFWAIWGNFGPFGVIFGPFWIILGHSRATLGHLGSYLGHFGPFWVILGRFWAILWHFWTNLRTFFCGIVGVRILAFRMYGHNPQVGEATSKESWEGRGQGGAEPATEAGGPDRQGQRHDDNQQTPHFCPY